MSAGLKVAYGTASSLRAVSSDESEAGGRERVERAADALRAQLEKRDKPHPGVSFELRMTSADDATG